MLRDYFQQYTELVKKIKELKEELKGIEEGILEELKDGEIYTDTDAEGKVWRFEKNVKTSLKIKKPKAREKNGEEKW